jgi:hypothetical protein
MWVTARIRNFLGKLADGALFTTRELLNFGRRAAVDTALFRMARNGEIEKHANGVYAKKSFGVESQISETEIANAKAAAFGKRIMPHEANIACDLNLSQDRPQQTIFETDGRSTQFRLVKSGKMIHFRGVSARKMRLKDGTAARCIRALWHLNKEQCTPAIIKNTAASLGRREREELTTMCRWMPARISDWIIDYKYGTARREYMKPAPGHRTVNEVTTTALIYQLHNPALCSSLEIAKTKLRS